MFEQDQLDNPTEICNCSQHLFDKSERKVLASQSAPEQHASILSKIVKRLRTPHADLEQEQAGNPNTTSVQDFVANTHPIVNLRMENPISSKHPLAEKYQQHKSLTQELGQHTAQVMATRASRRRHLPEQYSEDREWGESPEGMSTLSDWAKEDSLHSSKSLGLKSRLHVLEQDLKDLPKSPGNDLESHIAFHAAGAGIDRAKEIMGVSDQDLEERPKVPEVTRSTTRPKDIFEKKIPVQPLSITTGPSTPEVLDTILRGKTREPRMGTIMDFSKNYEDHKKEAGIAEHLQFLPEIAKGIGHVVKNTIMEPANVVKSVGHLVNELATGKGAPATPKGDYYGTPPFHLTPTEEGAPGAAYLINKGMDAVKGLMPKGKHEAAKKTEQPPMCLDCGRKTGDCKGKFDCRQFVLEKLRGVDPHQMDMS